METIIIGRQGDQPLPITDGSVSRKHCKVIHQGDGRYIIENLSKYGTKVDGKDIVRTTATLESKLQLGPNYTATLGQLLKRGKNPGPGPAPDVRKVPAYDISHLKNIWDEFNETNIGNAAQQRKINMIRAGMGIFTMCTMPVIFILNKFAESYVFIGYSLTAIGIIGNIYSLFGMKNSETPEERQKRQDEFDAAWVCPHPPCRRSLQAKNFNMLVRNHKNCPFCKAKYVYRPKPY